MSQRSARRPAIFLDRDGVINENRADYVKSWEELRLLPGVLDALRTLAATPYAVVVVSNQAAVNRGLMSRHTLEEMHCRLHTLVAASAVSWMPSTTAPTAPMSQQLSQTAARYAAASGRPPRPRPRAVVPGG